VDSGVREGDAISPHYDSMIAKLIVWGESRHQALARLAAALAQTHIVGLATNVAFLRRVLGTTAFSTADLDTALIERERAALFDAAPLPLECAAAGVVARELALESAQQDADPWSRRDGWRLQQVVESTLSRLQLPADKTLADEVAAMDAAMAHLQAGTPLYRSDLTPEQRSLLKPFFLLTAKPAMALVNLDEGQLEDPEPLLEPVRQAMGTISGVPAQDTVVGLCIQLEAEAALLDPESRTEMLEALGMGDGALPQFLHGAYAMLGLRTFFTTGEKESRAWTFRAGYKAPQAAGVIHTDFERGFIRAETIDWQELLEAGSWSAARDAGTLRVEGKDYEVADGDVMEFRFNV
jgi:hypothetical protein